MEVEFKQGRGSKKSFRMSNKAVCPTQRDTKILGELENGILFLLTPEWLREWEEDDEAAKQVVTGGAEQSAHIRRHYIERHHKTLR